MAKRIQLSVRFKRIKEFSDVLDGRLGGGEGEYQGMTKIHKLFTGFVRIKKKLNVCVLKSFF